MEVSGAQSHLLPCGSTLLFQTGLSLSQNRNCSGSLNSTFPKTTCGKRLTVFLVLYNRKLLHNFPEISIQKRNKNARYSHELKSHFTRHPQLHSNWRFLPSQKQRIAPTSLRWARSLVWQGPDEKDLREKEGEGKGTTRCFQTSHDGTNTTAANLPWPQRSREEKHRALNAGGCLGDAGTAWGCVSFQVTF